MNNSDFKNSSFYWVFCSFYSLIQALIYWALFRTKSTSSIWQSFQYLKAVFIFLLSLFSSRHIITTSFHCSLTILNLHAHFNVRRGNWSRMEVARAKHNILDVVWSKQTIEELLLCPWLSLKICYWRLRYIWDCNIHLIRVILILLSAHVPKFCLYELQ